MSLKDRLKTGSPTGTALVPLLDETITKVNELIRKVLGGAAPHLEDDTINTVTVPDASDLDGVMLLSAFLSFSYLFHGMSAVYHLEADGVNYTSGTPTLYFAIQLAIELKGVYNLHHVRTTDDVHAGGDDPNTVTADDPLLNPGGSFVVQFVALWNDIKAKFNLHLANTSSCHGVADEDNVVTLDDLTVDSTPTEAIAFANDVAEKYMAHIALVDSVHGAEDTHNRIGSITIPITNFQTTANAVLNEMKSVFNAHIIYLTSHQVEDLDNEVTAANATSLGTSITLANQIKAKLNDHLIYSDELSEYLITPLDQPI